MRPCGTSQSGQTFVHGGHRPPPIRIGPSGPGSSILRRDAQSGKDVLDNEGCTQHQPFGLVMNSATLNNCVGSLQCNQCKRTHSTLEALCANHMGKMALSNELFEIAAQIAWEAACLMYHRQESEYFRAKQKAARRICRSWVKPADLPSNAEIRDEIQALARMYEGDHRTDDLREMRLEALWMMRLLARFRPRLIGSVMTGHVRKGSDIDLHVFADKVEHVTSALDEHGYVYDVERKRVRKQGEERIFTHIHVRDRFPFELTIYASDKAHYVFKSSITGKAIERASLAELEQLISTEYPQLNLDEALEQVEQKVDRFQVFEALLLPLEYVKQSPKYHPEGDALYHSLQVFDLARDELPYDEEFLARRALARCRQSH